MIMKEIYRIPSIYRIRISVYFQNYLFNYNQIAYTSI